MRAVFLLAFIFVATACGDGSGGLADMGIDAEIADAAPDAEPPPDEPCLDGCPVEAVCYAGECVPRGSQLCDDVFTCMGGCGGGDTCEVNCITLAMPVEQQKLIQLVRCFDRTACETGEACEEACPDETLACFDDGPITLDCVEVIQCLNGCVEATCAEDCLGAATAEAEAAVRALANCQHDADCDGDDCRAACGPELDACEAS